MISLYVSLPGSQGEPGHWTETHLWLQAWHHFFDLYFLGLCLIGLCCTQASGSLYFGSRFFLNVYYRFKQWGERRREGLRDWEGMFGKKRQTAFIFNHSRSLHLQDLQLQFFFVSDSFSLTVVILYVSMYISCLYYSFKNLTNCYLVLFQRFILCILGVVRREVTVCFQMDFSYAHVWYTSGDCGRGMIVSEACLHEKSF